MTEFEQSKAEHDAQVRRLYSERGNFVNTPARAQGCICPAGANLTCQAPLCPRKPYPSGAGSVAWRQILAREASKGNGGE
jgi:hypothetical protein